MSSNHIRKFMDLVEYGPKIGTTDSAVTYRDLDGRAMNANISYNITPGKVVAQLSSYNSQVYTKLAQKINRIDALEKRIKQLKEQVKEETRENIFELFSLDDISSTRVVETLQFIFTLSKDPKPTLTYKYADILKELEAHLTPELIKVLEEIKSKYESVVQKAPSLKLVKKEGVEMNEGLGDKLTAFIAKFKATIVKWASKYDAKLDALKAQAAAVTETFSYEEGHTSTGLMRSIANEAPEMAFSNGDVVYCGSRQGKILHRSEDNPDAFVVELPNGEMDVFPAAKCSAEKPSMMRRATQWMMGEDDESMDGDDEQGLTEAPIKHKFTVTIPGWDGVNDEATVGVDADVSDEGEVFINGVYDHDGNDITRQIPEESIDQIIDEVWSQHKSKANSARDDAAYDRFMNSKDGDL